MDNTEKIRLYKLAHLLWQDIADNGYAHKEQSKYYRGYCPLCEIYMPANGCKGCSLVLCDDASFACLEKDHPYILWIRGINEKENAQKIANLIKIGMERLCTGETMAKHIIKNAEDIRCPKCFSLNLHVISMALNDQGRVGCKDCGAEYSYCKNNNGNYDMED